MDQHSFARPHEARVTSVALDLRVDITGRRLVGHATLSFVRARDSRVLVLDTNGLEIRSVSDERGALPYTLGDPVPFLGRPLTITLNSSDRPITIEYATSPDAAALQWLEPAQTAGKRHPFLYSQGQAILTRTWIPTQDSPGVRQTYSARIVVPPGLKAVMSAAALTPRGEDVEDGRAFRFALDHPVPPYLIALAVGDLSFVPLGPRSGVYAEPVTVDAAAWEFADVERMIEAAESLLGPYQWGRYDVLVLPPSFPFGGMENPCVTFATPTILAGDRSLVSLIAHELAHSWSGNLVSNATWRDLWLNEGVTTYVELRIMEALYGRERADMLRVIARRELAEEIARLGGPASPDTILHVDLEGRDPDEGATRIPYDKGAALMMLLEETFGRERFDAYLRGYFERHGFRSIDTGTFTSDLREHLTRDQATEDALQLRDWIFSPGLPANVVPLQSPALAAVEEQAQAFAAGTPAVTVNASAWTTPEWLHFLASLPVRMTTEQLDDLDRTFVLSARGNSEILFAWLRMAIRHHYEPAMPAVERFLTTQGRRRFLRPLYEDLMTSEWGRPHARRIYGRARATYHAVSASTIDAIVR